MRSYESALPDEQRYEAVLSPPLFLTLALLLGHSAAAALGQTDAIIANRHGLAGLIDDNASALILRIIVFAAFPLFLAARLVRRRRLGLNKASLQESFYGQCYPASASALGISVGTSLVVEHHPLFRAAGQCLVAASIVNFWLAETRWFANVLGTGLLRAAGNVLVGLTEGLLILIAVGFLFTRLVSSLVR